MTAAMCLAASFLPKFLLCLCGLVCSTSVPMYRIGLMLPTKEEAAAMKPHAISHTACYEASQDVNAHFKEFYFISSHRTGSAQCFGVWFNSSWPTACGYHRSSPRRKRQVRSTTDRLGERSAYFSSTTALTNESASPTRLVIRSFHGSSQVNKHTGMRYSILFCSLIGKTSLS